MYMCLFVCVHVCLCVYVHTCMCIYMCVICLFVCVHVCLCVCVGHYSSCCYWNHYRFRVQTPFHKKKVVRCIFLVLFYSSSVAVTDEDHLIFCVIDCPNLQCYSDIEALEHHLLHTM